MQRAVIWGNLADMPPSAVLRRYLPEVRLQPQLKANARLKQRRQSSILAHFLLVKLLEHFRQPISFIERIQRTASGRPYFADTPQIDFNISHSGDWVAVVIAITEPHESAVAVAVDIESPQKQRNFDGLMRFYASESERRWFERQARREAAFYRTWCPREAVLKSQGVGIVKLRSVVHQPQQLRIQCDYAPKGKLFFSDELPFYLAYFLQQNEETLPELFHWQTALVPIKCLRQMIYQVN
ncbi:4'-phosphopantetheinyl transferase family protein [Chelonobacter oris]|uniref:4'-phosphopantetheinyl transferase family protein n=1 Tax=Chelonobacter oris TaxID=505317 RepID=UPI00068B4CD9|nr:4'-phosphopantetheinyl transferase superfamily protein [Chelonobacter oris]